MANAQLTPGECILRALTASEIADSCTEPSLRSWFLDLTSSWLARAEGGSPEASEGSDHATS